MRTTIIKWLILTALLSYVIGMSLWAEAEAAKQVCVGINIAIAQTRSVDAVTVKGVGEELGRFPGKIVGAPLLSLDTREIENYLSGYSNFEDVECAVTSFGRLDVTIVPMIPELRVFDGTDSYYINKDGKRIESKANFFVDVPVVSGDFTESFTPRNLLSVVRFIQKDPVLSQLVGMVEFRDPENIMLVPRIHGHIINLGDTTCLAEKRAALVTMYRKVIPYKGWETYDTISVKFRGQIVATRRDKKRPIHSLPFEEGEDPEEATLPETDYITKPKANE